MSETVHTLDILAENGIEYVGNWVNDDQPYPMRVKKGSMISMPYSDELNDIPALLGLHQSPERFGQMICDQFDVLYEDGAKTGRVMSICLHPFLIGHPHRSKYFAKALAHITSRQEVWLTTGSEIVDWYKKKLSQKLTINRAKVRQAKMQPNGGLSLFATRAPGWSILIRLLVGLVVFFPEGIQKLIFPGYAGSGTLCQYRHSLS